MALIVGCRAGEDGASSPIAQWGRIYELRAELAAARSFDEAARARLPTLEATVHLAQVIAAAHGDPGAPIAAALVDNRHPELRALAGDPARARLARIDDKNRKTLETRALVARLGIVPSAP